MKLPIKSAGNYLIVDADGNEFCHVVNGTSEHREKIVRAVNSHEALLLALKTLMARAVKDAEQYAPDGNETVWAVIADAQDAIAQAEGR